MLIPKIPIIQKMKIPPNNMAPIKAAVMMTFLFPRDSIGRVDQRNGCVQLRQGGVRSRPLQPLVVVRLV